MLEAQTKTLKVPNTGMAVTTDIGDVKDIHPKNKQKSAAGLPCGLAKTYGKSDLVYSGRCTTRWRSKETRFA